MVRLAVLLTALLVATTAQANTTVEFPLFEGGAGKTFFLQAAREYEKIHPEVTIDLYLDPRIQEKVQVRFLEGSFFECTNVALNYWPLIDDGDVVAMDQYFDGPSWDTVDANGKPVKWGDTFLPGSLDTYTQDGKHYGVPLGYYAYVFWYNRAMFREHGWKTPSTWNELFALCETIKQAGIPPMAFQGRYPYYATFLYDAVTYHEAGAKQWIARQNLAPGSIAAPESVDGIAIVQRLARQYFQAGALGMSHTESQLQFFLGHTAIIPCGAWLKSEMLGKIPDGFELGCFNLPYTEGTKEDKSAVRVAAEPFMIFTHSKHPEIAIDFVRFMTSRKMAGLFARMQDIPTAIRGANEGNLSKDLDELVTLVNNAKTSYGAVPGAGYPEMFQVYQDMMYDTIATDMTPEAIAKKYEAQGQELRARKLYPDRIENHHRVATCVFLGLLGLGAVYWFARTARDLNRRRRRMGIIASAGLARLSLGNILLFITPALLLYTAFVIVPSARSFSWSLHEWNGITHMESMPFVGMRNFRRLLLEGDGFWIALRNNLFLMFMVPIFVVPLALFLAACISRGIWGGKFFRVTFFFPNLLGGVAATLLWLQLYNPQGGLVNKILAPLFRPAAPKFVASGSWLITHFVGLHIGRRFIGIGAWHIGTMLVAIGQWMGGIEHFTWLEPKHLYWAIIPISIWGTVGFNMVLYLAAMQGVDESYYEAATIEGASPWQQFWTITIPLIWDIIVISIVFLVIGGMKAFDVIWLLSNQRPQTDAHTIATRMVQTMFTEFRVGEAAALAVLLFLMVFVGSAATMRGMSRDRVET